MLIIETVHTSFLLLDQWGKSPPNSRLSHDRKSWCGSLSLRADDVAKLAVETKSCKKHNKLKQQQKPTPNEPTGKK